MNARYYNGKIGRFISQDSLVLNTPEKILQDPQALNSYAYARNNPLKYVDPTGNFFETAWDVGNLIYDAGRLVKNTVEVNVGLAKYGYGVITKNQALQNSALTQMSGDLGDLKSAGIDTAFDAGATMIPFVPAGMTKAVGKADDVAKISEKYFWGNLRTLEKHFRDHGADFGAKNAGDYAQKASEFFKNSQKNGLETLYDAKEKTIRIYDRATNTFGAFRAGGETRSFYKPSNPLYWDNNKSKWGQEIMDLGKLIK